MERTVERRTSADLGVLVEQVAPALLGLAVLGLSLWADLLEESA